MSEFPKLRAVQYNADVDVKFQPVDLVDEAGRQFLRIGTTPEALPLARLYAAAPDMLEALKTAAKAFRQYEASHNAKGTVEGAQKAAANKYRAELCEAAITRAEPPAAVARAEQSQ